ncbi:unnamed protein product [Heligmosomoides polygyrus]|uniref:Sterol regulatory element-binding protein cleavage-activating protein n=1 Tax=Heligmosomoides polygyrus TaxID=6339 RepID=A0A3P8A8R2_HELPZ|nr:unnamed protein product [Heligmosomoides polygyrus]
MSQDEVDALCLQVNLEDVGSDFLFSQHGCLLLDPTIFWQRSMDKFMADTNVLATLFSRECSPVMCLRDLLLGIPTTLTGIKPAYRSNRKRTIDFSLTLFLARYDRDMRSSLLKSMTSRKEFDSASLHSEEGNQFAHVFYRHRKAFTDYLPLLTSYAIFTFYLYYSARKFEMVASRWSLAFAAAFAVGATLVMTTGVCAHLELSPTLWGAEIFPYIALILGLENTLCITRAVVYTPPSLDVSSRIAHGLAQEGYSLCKYFVMELSFLAAGYATRIAEIQEFCMFAFIGLVIDFYMQMFFYAPCLTFDLHRLSPEEKRKFAFKLFNTDIPHLNDFVPVRCPMRKWWPAFFESKRMKKRTLSESQLDERDITEDSTDRKDAKLFTVEQAHNRQNDKIWSTEAPSNSAVVEHRQNPQSAMVIVPSEFHLPSFTCLVHLYFQRTIMAIFALWTIWLAFVVHEHGNFSFNSSRTDLVSDLIKGVNASQTSSDAALGDWQARSERTFKWFVHCFSFVFPVADGDSCCRWPSLFAEFNLSLSGGYLTFLPPIILNTTVPKRISRWILVDALDPFLFANASLSGTSGTSMKRTLSHPSDTDSRSALKSRISWLETQLRLYLAIVWLTLLMCVVGFVLYACFWGRWRTDRIRNKLPTVFSGHRFPIESVAICNNTYLVSCCQEGKVCLWNIDSGKFN